MGLSFRKFDTPFMTAIRRDRSLPIADVAVDMWINDLKGGLRWAVMPVLRVIFAASLYLTWFIKRASPVQFNSHKNLQRLICWFCTYFVTPEANYLILRHFWTESNILNFLIDNDAKGSNVKPVQLYPAKISEMMSATFVDHDQELFRYFNDSSPRPQALINASEISWENWKEIQLDGEVMKRKFTQRIDFETAHVLFMCIFCFFLTADEYRGAINGFNLDQSIAIRIGALIGDDSLVEYAYNKNPLYLVGPTDLTHRFILHGFFTEYMHERLLQYKNAS